MLFFRHEAPPSGSQHPRLQPAADACGALPGSDGVGRRAGRASPAGAPSGHRAQSVGGRARRSGRARRARCLHWLAALSPFTAQHAVRLRTRWNVPRATFQLRSRSVQRDGRPPPQPPARGLRPGERSHQHGLRHCHPVQCWLARSGAVQGGADVRTPVIRRLHLGEGRGSDPSREFVRRGRPHRAHRRPLSRRWAPMPSSFICYGRSITVSSTALASASRSVRGAPRSRGRGAVDHEARCAAWSRPCRARCCCGTGWPASPPTSTMAWLPAKYTCQ